MKSALGCVHRMCWLALWASWAAPAAVGGAPDAGSAVLCSSQETVYFSCPTPRGRTVALCGTPGGTLQYRFGRPGAIELRFPENAAVGRDQMLFAHYSRYQTDRTEIRFENQGVDYALFDYYEGGKRRSGVRVTTPDSKEREISCTAPATSRLGKLKNELKCDADSALNSGTCP